MSLSAFPLPTSDLADTSGRASEGRSSIRLRPIAPGGSDAGAKRGDRRPLIVEALEDLRKARLREDAVDLLLRAEQLQVCTPHERRLLERDQIAQAGAIDEADQLEVQ